MKRDLYQPERRKLQAPVPLRNATESLANHLHCGKEEETISKAYWRSKLIGYYYELR